MPNEKAPTTEELRNAVMFMDNLSQMGFDRINGIARAALYALECPEAHRNAEMFARLFDAIVGICDDVSNSIGCEAQRVGANFENCEWERRLDAAFEARKAGGATS